jgi:hypothetical protein
MPKSAGQHPLCQKLLEQAPEQLPELAEASGVAGCSGTVFSIPDADHVYSMPCAALIGHICKTQDLGVQV